MFTGFLFHLRSFGLKVSMMEWLALMRALSEGFSRSNLTVFYHLSRALLVKKEADFDAFDRAFATYFRDVSEVFEVTEEILSWLENPKMPRDLTDEERKALKELGFEDLLATFKKRLEEQDGRHDKGNRWVGTAGTSPFGNTGKHPEGIRAEGARGNRSAVQIAESRRFRNLRNDRILDTRQIGVALRRLRKLEKDEGPLELDLDKTIDHAARNAGEIDLIFAPPKKNRVKLLLLIDVGGSMDPHTQLCERVFSAAHRASHFKKFESRFFHNCIYEKVYTDISRWKGEPTKDMMKRVDDTWTVVLVGDAWMSPYELSYSGGALDYYHENPDTGLEWLKRLRRRCPKSVWLNPEPKRIWNAPTIRQIRQVFPMFPLTIDGLSDAVDVLRGAKPNKAVADPLPDESRSFGT
jgi:uncharacterized protein with von Willebrand factor type A (vWA) domain